MKRFLWILTIVGSVICGLFLLSSALAANDAPQTLASRPASAQSECDCSHLKTLQIELRNAIRLQQAFRNKIAELRTMNGDSAQVALKVFAEGEARRGLEAVPGYKGPSEFDYSPWGENQRTFNFPTERLCGMSDSAKVKLDQAVAASACDGIGKALRAHEGVHGNMCRSIGYKAYLGMHGADRAQEEVEAYEAQIKVLRAEIAKVLERAACCDAQWYGTVTYTYIVSGKSNKTISPANPRPPASSDGGTESQDWTITQSGTVTVYGNEWIANSSADYAFVNEELKSGKTYCHGGLAGPKGPLVGWSTRASEVRNGGGNSQGKVTPGISLNKDHYRISIKPLTVNGTVQSTTQSSSSGGCPPAKPPTSHSNSYSQQFGSNDYIVGSASYGEDRNILSGSDTKTRSTPTSSSPPAVPGLPTSTITGSITTTTTVTWNLRRCNRETTERKVNF